MGVTEQWAGSRCQQLHLVALRIMSRATLHLDDSILEQLGRLAYNRLAGRTRGEGPARTVFSWTSQPMGARIDLADNEALYSTLDRPEAGS